VDRPEPRESRFEFPLVGTFAVADKAKAGPFKTMDEQLISPAINLSNYSGVKVAFGQKFVAGFGDQAIVEYSFDGSAWVNIHTFKWPQDGKSEFDVPAMDTQPQVYLRFHYVAGIPGQWWGIDNILVSGFRTRPRRPFPHRPRRRTVPADDDADEHFD